MQNFYLRELSIDDKCSINKWRNDRELVQMLGSPFRYIDESIDSNWLESYFSNRSNCVRLAICEKQSDKIIGAVYLLSVDWISRCCEFAIWIGESEYKGKGAGTYGTKNALRHAFFDLNMHRVYLTVLEDNSTAIALYRKNGFSEEGIHREAVYKEGKYLNMVQMSILKNEFVY